MVAGMMVLISGCTSFPPRIAFNVGEHEKLPKIDSGTSTVQGQAFLKTMDGTVKYAAGNEVIIAPVTSYTNQFYKDYYIPSKSSWAASYDAAAYWNGVPKADSRFKKYYLSTQADGEGRFEFTNVASGKYYINGWIIWMIPSGSYTTRAQGGVLMKKVQVEEGKDLKVVLAR